MAQPSEFWHGFVRSCTTFHSINRAPAVGVESASSGGRSWIRIRHIRMVRTTSSCEPFHLPLGRLICAFRGSGRRSFRVRTLNSAFGPYVFARTGLHSPPPPPSKPSGLRIVPIPFLFAHKVKTSLLSRWCLWMAMSLSMFSSGDTVAATNESKARQQTVP